MLVADEVKVSLQGKVSARYRSNFSWIRSMPSVPSGLMSFSC